MAVALQDDALPDDLFAALYSPRRVRFWLAHWDYLAGLAYAPAANRGRGEWLKREWALLQGSTGTCACDELDDAPPLAIAPSGGSYQAASTSAANIKADLERAANALPLEWKATKIIFAVQGRSREWGVRAAQEWSRRQRCQEPTPLEPPGAPFLCTERMARSLGWRPTH